MLGRLLRVARPDDWTGTLSRVVIGVAAVLLGVVVVLARVPSAWVALAQGEVVLARASLLVVGLLALGVARTLLVARLPRAPVLFAGKVRLHDGTRRIAIPYDEIAALHVEQRPSPAHEVFVVEQRNGAEHDLCPTHWWGAPGLHRALERRVTAAQRRRARLQQRRPAAGSSA